MTLDTSFHTEQYRTMKTKNNSDRGEAEEEEEKAEEQQQQQQQNQEEKKKKKMVEVIKKKTMTTIMMKMKKCFKEHVICSLLSHRSDTNCN